MVDHQESSRRSRYRGNRPPLAAMCRDPRSTISDQQPTTRDLQQY
jgi:hypothetical protein